MLLYPNDKVVQTFTSRVQPITAVILLLFELGGRIPYLGPIVHLVYCITVYTKHFYKICITFVSYLYHIFTMSAQRLRR